jgi:hypothetical protein
MAGERSRSGLLVADALLAAALLAVFVALAVRGGGFSPLVTLPATLFVLGLTAVTVAARPEIVRGLGRPQRVALAAIAGFTAWSYASILWADAPASAWDGANRALLYLLVFGLVLVWPWQERAAVALLAGFSLAVALIAVGSAVFTARTQDVAGELIDGLFSAPVGYHNATAALFLIAFWPAVVFAAQRELHVLLRGLLLSSAGILAALAVTAQSRGALFVFPIVAVLVVALSPGRARILLALVGVVAAIVPTLPTLLDVYDEALAGRGGQAMEDALAAITAVAVALFVLGVGWGVLDRRVQLQPRVARLASGALVVVVAATCVVGVAFALPEDPIGWSKDSWREFKDGDRPDDAASHFSSSLGSNRYDFWRVGLDEFRSHPFHGIGADNFANPYLLQGRSLETPMYPHSLEIQVLSQLGLVGGALLAIFLGAVLVSAFGRPRRHAVAVTVAALAAVAYWAAHSSGDWFWELPALTAPVFAFLALAAGRDGMPNAQGLGLAGAAAIGALVVVGAAAVALPWLSALEVRAAAHRWQSDPGEAYSRLERARSLNPLSPRADLVAAAIASRRGEWARMASASERALTRTPHSWYAHLELALALAATGRREEALKELAGAEALNPRERALALVRERLRNGRDVSPAEIDRLFLERVAELKR